ncbi:MAG: hypothetical protein ACI8W0_001609, partial [Flavobacterium sp.]
RPARLKARCVAFLLKTLAKTVRVFLFVIKSGFVKAIVDGEKGKPSLDHIVFACFYMPPSCKKWCGVITSTEVVLDAIKSLFSTK